ncbi:hypothetical protein HPB48_006050 [Haemaphysalis longicornis]|uniref:Uncharacterized protein n=1 Tax=Haemaphysalis longicornis TaxID=44386 RepID=A0A9J6FNG3_HAELO|nr:hypothetical protein HPB48_006050 [Haemaphysalis longicornis]
MVEQLEKEFIADINEGADGTDSRCGVIGELGCSWPLHGEYKRSPSNSNARPFDFEKRVLQAAASAQESTGAPAIIHPGRDPKAPSEIARLFSEAGGKDEAHGHVTPGK